jgi:hypothetical protein
MMDSGRIILTGDFFQIDDDLLLFSKVRGPNSAPHATAHCSQAVPMS